MDKIYYSLGLMSGTSGDGVDASIIQSDGDGVYKVILNKYFEYNKEIRQKLSNIRNEVKNYRDLLNLKTKINKLEKIITIFHGKLSKQIINDSNVNIDLIGFHGQTIFHNAQQKISKQLGNGKLLSKITKKIVINNFRENDMLNGGQGAPLTPIFHKLLVKKIKVKLPVTILNIGGIANVTNVDKNEKINSTDIGPGNCLIDQWIQSKTNKNFDKDGKIAVSGKRNKLILNKALKEWKKKYSKKNSLNRSYDTKDFDLKLFKKLSLSDGAATITEYTSIIISRYINLLPKKTKIILCGGGRKNKYLIKKILQQVKYNLYTTEKFGIDGDFVESQAFAFLAIRSYLNLPISFPKTTGVKLPCSGGIILKAK